MRAADLEKAWTKRMVRVGEWVAYLSTEGRLPGLEGAQLDEIRIRWGQPHRTDVLLVIKASVEEQRYVAFVGALTVADAMLAWRAKKMGGGLRWREDRPFGETRPGRRREGAGPGPSPSPPEEA